MSGGGRTIAIFGAGGATGAAAVRLAAERGLSVRAIEHDWPADAPDGAAVTHHAADVMQDDLAPLVDGADAVISAIGLGLSPQTVFDPPPLYTRGTGAIADAMERTGLRRLAVISATFVETRNIGPLWFRLSAMPALSRPMPRWLRWRICCARAARSTGPPRAPAGCSTCRTRATIA